MTPEQIEFHRKRFEDLFSSSYSFIFSPEMMAIQIFKRSEEHRLVTTINCYQCDAERYFESYKRSLLEGYLLCAQNLEAELPAALPLGGVTESDMLCRIAHNDLLSEVKFMLESQGINIK